MNNAISYLRSPSTIRAHCQQLFELAIEGQLLHFHLREKKLPEVISYVMEEITTHYPDYDIPYHSRFRHFEVGGVDRLSLLHQQSSTYSSCEQAIRLFELSIVSVLLDAGAGEKWSYLDPTTKNSYTRSEGLAVASFHMFMDGLFSSDSSSRLQVDANGLLGLTMEKLAEAMQVTSQNPLVGLDGRVNVLNRLGEAMLQQPHFFGEYENPRLGELCTYLLSLSEKETLPADTILRTVLEAFSTIWPNGLLWNGVNVGDVGCHPLVKGSYGTDGLVPFHKLSQWLSYSLFEPLEMAGIAITDANAMTGLPEYRNGGLLLDFGVLRLKNEGDLQVKHSPQSELIVEWRALTVALLDIVGEEIRQILGKSKDEFPLVKVLQGGTWSAGRRIARGLRADGSPPLQIKSDGTVF